MINILFVLALSTTSTDPVLQLFITPTATTSETYLIRLYEDRSLEVMRDERLGSEQSFRLEMEEKKVKKLSENDFKQCLSFCRDLDKAGLQSADPDKYDDNWMIIARTNNGQPIFFFNGEYPTFVKKAFNLIFGLSPIFIDLHGWS